MNSFKLLLSLCVFMLVGCASHIAEVSAHRGLHTYVPDNSTQAIKLAAQAEIPYIELDFRRNSSGNIYLWHDRIVQVADQSELIGRPFSSLSDKEVARLTVDGHHVVTAQQAFSLLQGKASYAQLDLKDETPDTIAQLIELARSLGIDSQLVVQCQEKFCHELMSGSDPEIQWLARVHEPEEFDAFLALKPASIQVDSTFALDFQINSAHEAGTLLLIKTLGDNVDNRYCWRCFNNMG